MSKVTTQLADEIGAVVEGNFTCAELIDKACDMIEEMEQGLEREIAVIPPTMNTGMFTDFQKAKEIAKIYNRPWNNKEYRYQMWSVWMTNYLTYYVGQRPLYPILKLRDMEYHPVKVYYTEDGGHSYVRY